MYNMNFDNLLDQILRSLYEQMFQAAAMRGHGGVWRKALPGWAILFYVAYRVWQSLATPNR